MVASWITHANILGLVITPRIKTPTDAAVAAVAAGGAAAREMERNSGTSRINEVVGAGVVEAGAVGVGVGVALVATANLASA